jgi:hypothetical protein
MGYTSPTRRTNIDNQDSNDIIPAHPLGPHQSATLMGEGPWGSLLAAEGATRHDGWTGALMARFCEVLAETGIVVDACLAVGKSANTAYANRRRDPLFAAMWEAALGIARNRLADALLARSIEGSVEYYYRDGELIGEKRHIDNRLGLAVLRRLDRLMETGSPLPYRTIPNSVLLRRQEPSSALTGPLPSQGNNGPPALDWDQMIGALRTGEPGAMAVALAALKASETHETHDPQNRVAFHLPPKMITKSRIAPTPCGRAMRTGGRTSRRRPISKGSSTANGAAATTGAPAPVRRRR